MSVSKAIRTIQSQFWFLKGLKDDFYFWSRRILRKPHDHDFNALRLLKNLEDGVFLDIGGNHGQSIESIRLMRTDARIISFEPNPNLYAKLKTRYFKDENIEVRGFGLGSSSAVLDLFVPDYRGFVYDGLASLDQNSAMEWINSDRVYLFDQKKLNVTKYPCQIETLDSQNLSPVFLKIDVQGTEYDVITGGLETIMKYKPIILVEDFHGDARLVDIMKELLYVEYYYNGTNLIRGVSTGPNSFLVPSSKLTALGLD